MKCYLPDRKYHMQKLVGNTMLKEQQNTIETFKTHFAGRCQEKLVLYGTGIHAEAVVKNCPDYHIVGLMDVAKTGEKLWGLTVLSEDEIVEAGVRCIVAVARPAVLSVIYKRIQAWSEENGISVCDIYGNSLADRIKDRKRESSYFGLSYGMLLKEVDIHETISFDIFDTLLTRCVYEPRDVFSLLDAEYQNELPFLFSQVRIEAEQELQSAEEADIFQIYHWIREKYHLSAEKTQDMQQNEIKKEKQVLLVRGRMAECLQYCVAKGKKVYLVSDMYFTKEILRDILDGLGVMGYHDIFVSCEHGCSKRNGLFEIFKEKTGTSSWIHIGDSHEADSLAAKRSGGDTFEILPPMRMMELSTYHLLLADIKSMEARMMVGMLAARVFCDPFALCHSGGKPKVDSMQDFGYLFIAPAMVSFLLWLFSVLEKRRNALLIFSARDGWLLQKIYRIFKESANITDLPEDIYLLISRKAIGIVAEEGFEEERRNYLKYLKQFELEKYETVYFFDFMSRGTCQSGLEDVIKGKLQGVYFQKSLSGDPKKDGLQAMCFFKEKSALEKDLRIFVMCDFLECILTSPEPSFWKMDCQGNPVYEEEQRPVWQRESIKKIHEGIFQYCKKFAEVAKPFEGSILLPEFCDEILRFTDSAASRIELPELWEFQLDDIATVKKNTGRDVLA